MVKQRGNMKRLLGQLSAWCGVVGLTTALLVGLDGKAEAYGGMLFLGHEDFSIPLHLMERVSLSIFLWTCHKENSENNEKP